MSKPVTCALCGGEVDDADSVPMPNGPMCFDPCYLWLENMMEEVDPEDDEEVTLYFFDDDEDEDDSWAGEDLV